MGCDLRGKALIKKTLLTILIIDLCLIVFSQENTDNNSAEKSVIEIQSVLDTLGSGMTEREAVENQIIADYHSHRFKKSYTDIALKNIVVFLGGGAVTCGVFLVYAAISEFGAATSGLYSPEAQYIYRNIINISAAGGALSAATFDLLEYINEKNERARANDKK